MTPSRAALFGILWIAAILAIALIAHWSIQP
jgi:hypothetical protein